MTTENKKVDMQRLDAYVLAALQGELVNRKPNTTNAQLFEQVYKLAIGMMQLVDSKSEVL